MKHVKQITAPKKAQETWWYAIGGIIGGLIIDNFWIDAGNNPIKKINPL